MAKSVRSKWKKKQSRVKQDLLKPEVHARLERLSKKLELVAQRKISSVPMQDPSPHFFHTHPGIDSTQPLKLSNFSTNVRKGLRGHEGNADGTTASTAGRIRNAKYHPLQGQQQQQQQQEQNQEDSLLTGSSSATAAAASSSSSSFNQRGGQKNKKVNQMQVNQEGEEYYDDDDDDDDEEELTPEEQQAFLRALQQQQEQEEQQRPKKVILPKADEKKKGGAKKQKENVVGTRMIGGVQSSKGGTRKKPKQGYDRPTK